MTHKSVHTSFFKSLWNLAKVLDLHFKVQPNHLRHCGSFWGGNKRGNGGENVAVMRVGGCCTVVHVSTCKLLLELLHILVTFVRGLTVSSKRLK